ncbi:hypothetical protein RIF29_24170 [Crotalaria pallida]|uniref:Uncharacterized protein n=1 Tax=Crotalaria pallida TaxID=3830 RepID=A0AAN9EK36_CROPI
MDDASGRKRRRSNICEGHEDGCYVRLPSMLRVGPGKHVLRSHVNVGDVRLPSVLSVTRIPSVEYSGSDGSFVMLGAMLKLLPGKHLLRDGGFGRCTEKYSALDDQLKPIGLGDNCRSGAVGQGALGVCREGPDGGNFEIRTTYEVGSSSRSNFKVGGSIQAAGDLGVCRESPGGGDFEIRTTYEFGSSSRSNFEGDKIQGTINDPDAMKKHGKNLQEGKVIQISKFGVGPSTLPFRPAKNPNRITIYFGTKIENCVEDIQCAEFEFVSFEEISLDTNLEETLKGIWKSGTISISRRCWTKDYADTFQ